MGGEITLLQPLDRHTADVIGIHVFLLIDRLQFALEHAENGVNQPFAVQLRPLRHVLRGEGIIIDRTVERRSGVQFRSAILGNQFVELVRDDELRRLHAQEVDLHLDEFAQYRNLFHRQFVV